MLQRARPDLWEAEGGNPLGPPGAVAESPESQVP
jgi:hypothetical protein